jgi:uncharacterized protein (DUF302 family)
MRLIVSVLFLSLLAMPAFSEDGLTGMELQPIELLLFGNPRFGTPLIAANRRVGIDLPMRVLVWEDPQKAVWIGYVEPDALKKRYGISGQDSAFDAMKSALEGLVSTAGK